MSVRSRTDRGSALMLMPAAVLIVFVLGSIALDFSIIYLRQRQALNLAADAANDAAIEAIDLAAFRTDGSFVLDADRLEMIAERYEESATFGDEVSVVVDTDPDRADLVVVTVSVDYQLVFAGVVPGAERRRQLSATATAVAEPGP